MPLHLIRHADAGSRAQWASAEDDLRPLSPLGKAQARQIAAALQSKGIVAILSSPSLRCRQTVEPLAALVGLEVADCPAFAEGGYGSDALDAALAAVGEHGTVAICSHGDVIPALVATARRRGAKLDGPPAPAKGARYLATIADGQITHLEAVGAPEVMAPPRPSPLRSGPATPFAR